MIQDRLWNSGDRGYQHMSFVSGVPYNHFKLEILDVEERPFNTIHDVFAEHLSGAILPVEVLYSGGLDSECVIVSCLQQKIPVVAITLRVLVNNCPLNIVDLYYSEKFCRQYGVKQVILDLHADKFVDSGDYIPYMERYQIENLGIISLHWLIEQCHTFPVIGGDYTWPLVNIGKAEYSPKSYNNYTIDLLMQDKAIPGISNFIGHSIESNNRFVREHMKVYADNQTTNHLKVSMLENLGFGKLEPRIKSHGWELLYGQRNYLNIEKTKLDFEKSCKSTKSTIVWNQNLADIVSGIPGENSEKYDKTVDK